MKLKHKIALHSFALTGLFSTAAYQMYADELQGYALRLQREQSFSQLVAEIPKRYGIPKPIVDVVLEKESGGKPLKRFEPAHLAKYGKRITSDPEQAREWSSSHCAFQIMAWHLKFKPDGTRYDGGEWFDLYKPEKCVSEFARIWKDCERKSQGKTKWETERQTFLCYNGAEAYADSSMQKLGMRLVEEM